MALHKLRLRRGDKNDHLGCFNLACSKGYSLGAGHTEEASSVTVNTGAAITAGKTSGKGSTRVCENGIGEPNCASWIAWYMIQSLDESSN
jgi:hypothetical protein